MKRSLLRLLSLVAFAAVMVGVETIVLRIAASRDVSMSLLAAGGALPYRALALAAGAMVFRLLTRFLVPGIIVRALVLEGYDLIVKRRAMSRPTSGQGKEQHAR